MPDRGKVIRPLQAKLDEVKADGLDVMLCSTEIIETVITLLKEQEPVKVKDCANIVDGIEVGYCPKCDRKIVWNPEKEETVAFCKYCGQAVEWND